MGRESGVCSLESGGEHGRSGILSANGVARELGVSARTVRSWREAGLIPWIEYPGEGGGVMIRYDVVEIRAWRDRRRRGPGYDVDGALEALREEARKIGAEMERAERRRGRG